MSKVTLHGICLMAMLACASLLPAGCAQEKSGIAKAREYLEKGELDPAMVAARGLLQRDALNADAQLLIGEVFAARGDLESAEREIRKAGNLGMDRATLDAALAEAMLTGGQYQRLLDEMRVDKQGDRDAAARLLAARGFAHLALGNAKDAALEFAEALKRAPDFPRALTGEGRLSLRERDAARAAALAERALAKQPHHLEAWSLKADAALASGGPDAAIAVYDEALKVVPGDVALRFSLARLQIAAGKMDDAEPHLVKLRKMARHHPMVNLLQALFHLRQGDHASARTYALAAIKVAPQYLPALLVLAESEVALGETQQAEARYLQMLQAAPRNPAVRKFYAAALLQMNQPARAIAVLDPLLKNDGGSDEELMLLAGEAHMQSGNYTKASAFLEKAAAATPSLASRVVTLGVRQMTTGDTEGGMAELVKAAQLDKDGSRAEPVLALIYLKRGEYAKALEGAKRLEAKQPKNPIAHDLAGAAYLGKGDREAARNSLQRALSLDANYLPAAVNLALLEMSMGQKDIARKRLEGVLARDNGNVDAIMALGRLDGTPGKLTRLLEQARAEDPKGLAVRRLLVRQYLVDNSLPAALEVAREMERIAPAKQETLEALGAALFASRQHKDALDVYARLRTVSPNPAAVEFRIGQVHTVLRDVNAAEAAYLKAAAMSPEYAEPVIALAQLYEQNGRAQDAMKLAEDLRGRFPKLPLGHELKGDLLVRAEQYAQASRSYEAAYALRPSGAIAVKHHGAMARAGAKADGTRLDQWLKAHPDDAATRQYLADQQLRAGDLVAAGENYRKVLKAQPDNAFAMNNLANVYLLQKDPRALETAQEALKLSPNNANIIDTVGFALTESGAAARAVPLLRKAVSLDPDSTEYRVHLATALARSGDREAARAEVKRLVDAGRRFQLDDATRAVLK